MLFTIKLQFSHELPDEIIKGTKNIITDNQKKNIEYVCYCIYFIVNCK